MISWSCVVMLLEGCIETRVYTNLNNIFIKTFLCKDAREGTES